MATSRARTLSSSSRSAGAGERRLNCSMSQVTSRAVTSARRRPARRARATISSLAAMLRPAVPTISAVVSICPASAASAPERSSTQAVT
jgi:hypothetical protein